MEILKYLLNFVFSFLPAFIVFCVCYSVVNVFWRKVLKKETETGDICSIAGVIAIMLVITFFQIEEEKIIEKERVYAYEQYLDGYSSGAIQGAEAVTDYIKDNYGYYESASIDVDEWIADYEYDELKYLPYELEEYINMLAIEIDEILDMDGQWIGEAVAEAKKRG